MGTFLDPHCSVEFLSTKHLFLQNDVKLSQPSFLLFKDNNMHLSYCFFFLDVGKRKENVEVYKAHIQFRKVLLNKRVL